MDDSKTSPKKRKLEEQPKSENPSKPAQYVSIQVYDMDPHWDFPSVETATRALHEWYTNILAKHPNLQCWRLDRPGEDRTEKDKLEHPISVETFEDMILSEDALDVEAKDEQDTRKLNAYYILLHFEVKTFESSMEDYGLYHFSRYPREKE